MQAQEIIPSSNPPQIDRPPIALRNKLPIEHPKYLYPKSRNIYSSKLAEFKHCAYANQDSENWAGRWKERFNKAKLVVEIGCNGGHLIQALAQRTPATLFVGIDWKYKQIYRACEKAKKSGLDNVAFLRAHAARLHYMFGHQEIDELLIYFPDPWPKKSQLKNRLLTRLWFCQMAPLMSKTGRLCLKTDHAEYFDFIVDQLKGTDQWELGSVQYDIHRPNPNPEDLDLPEVTLFEKIFIQQRKPIQLLSARPSNC